MQATEHSPAQNIVDIMGAVTNALQTTAKKSAPEKLKKPEVVAALLKVLHSIVASKEGPATSEKVQEISQAVSGNFMSDIDAVRAFVNDKANGMQ